MSSTQDKNVFSGFGAPESLPNARKIAYVSDALSKTEALEKLGTYVQSWERNVGRRFEMAVHAIGKDESVRLLGRSWKQLQRYFAGSEIPASVLSAVSRTLRVSGDYMLDGIVSRPADAELERAVISRLTHFINSEIESSTGDRLEHLMKSRGILMQRDAELCRIVSQSLNEDDLGGEALDSIRSYFGADDKKEPEEPFATIRPAGAQSRGVPIYDAALSLGQGRLNGDAPVVGYLDLPDAYVRDVLHAPPRHVVVAYSSGDSMSPTIKDRDLVLINTAVEAFDRDDIYAFSFKDEGYIKRLQRAGDAVVVHSDNPAYTDWSITGAELRDLRVIGRVVGIIQRP